MFFIPIAFLVFIVFLLSIPVLFLMGYFHVLIIGFENLGISSEHTLVILFLVLIGSLINIPLTKKKRVIVQKSSFFGLVKRPYVESHYIAINVGGAIIPMLLSLYFLFQGYQQGYDLEPVLIAVLLMTIVCKVFSKVIPGQGVVLHTLVPPLFSVLFSFLLVPSNFVAPCSFIAGVWGSLIGADLLNLYKIRKYGGLLSIGGAGVVDGIFLVGVVSALLSGW